MGFYINPSKGSKEDWLKDIGKLVMLADVKDFDFSRPERPVCLADNGAFTAAAIAFNEQELAVFLTPDPRPKRWFIVSNEKLLEFIPKEKLS